MSKVKRPKPAELAESQQAALLRLHLKLTAKAHALFLGYADSISLKLLSVAGSDGIISPVAQAGILLYADKAWRDMYAEWKALFTAGRAIAAAIPFGVLAQYHQYFIPAALSESSPVEIAARGVPFFEQQLQIILDETAARVYSDNFKLSDRIWRLDRDSRAGLRDAVNQVIASGESAYDGAKRVEKFLGAGRDCPRWTSTRLSLTKGEIAGGDTRGLLSGNPCGSEGVAYNALRLMRNEIQIAHHAASDALFARQPWIEKEQINLSPAHPVTDICDDVVGSGEGGEGIYDKGTILLPLHVQCLCYKTAVLMADTDFRDKMRDWLAGGEWAAMDDYAAWLGANRETVVGFLGSDVIKQLMFNFDTWLSGDETALDTALGEF